MNTKILYFKFKKKNTESNERNCKSKKNYANIFNNILNGEKNEPKSEYHVNKDDKDNKNKEVKKNRIKCISKVNNLNIKEEKHSTDVNKNKENKTKDISSKGIKPLYKTENNQSDKEKNSPYKDNATKIIDEKCKNLKIDLTRPFYINQKYDIKNTNSCNISLTEEKNNTDFQNEKKRVKKNLTKDSAMKYIKKTKQKKKEKEGQKKDLSLIKKVKIEEKKQKQRLIVNSINKLELTKLENISLVVKRKEKKKQMKSKTNRFSKKDNNKKFNNKKLPSFEFKSKKSKKLNSFNYVNKITITNDNIKENTNLKNNIKNFNYTLENDSKSKKLILNNTNSNINININITNINDKNINEKKTDYNNINKINKIKSENNYNNNITTVNIINNSNNSKKKLNDYRLLFYNRPKKEKYLPHYNKNNPKGIEIQSININLGEEVDDDFNKIKSKNNLTDNNKENNYNFHKKKEIENEKKEAQSEYEYYRDLDDFWSNRSQTSFSCKSGFTASRKLRSLSRERNKKKLLNNCQKKNEQDIERIGDKLLNIVNNFHNKSNSIQSIKNIKKINGNRKRYMTNKKYKYNTISTSDTKNRVPKKKKYQQ